MYNKIVSGKSLNRLPRSGLKWVYRIFNVHTCVLIIFNYKYRKLLSYYYINRKRICYKYYQLNHI